MKDYLFVLGRTPKLSELELAGFVSSIKSLQPDVVMASTDREPHELLQGLGGTIKACQVVYTGVKPTKEDIEKILFVEVKEQKLTFGISMYGKEDAFSPNILQAVKDVFVARGIHTRFIASKHDAPLSSVVVAKQKVSELVFIKSSDTWYVGITKAIQDFEQWNDRDFSRPFVDPRHGMLPPKVARMIVNIAKNKISNIVKKGEVPILLDPFCGTGTILVEALTMGWRVIGADNSPKAVERTQKNLVWARQRFALTPETISVVTCDATHISEVVQQSVHAIVTEPYMGNTNASDFGQVILKEKAKNNIKGLEKLYIGCLREWSKILVTGGVIVMALPQYSIGREVLFVKKVIDRCEILGYTLLDGPIEYGRDQAVVRREFFVFKKK